MRSCLSFCVSPSSNEGWEVRNVNRMSISYAFRPHLRDRLTLSGLTFLRKPWTFGAEGSHLRCRYLCRQGHFPTVDESSRSRFKLLGMLSYHAHLAVCIRCFGTKLEPR